MDTSSDSDTYDRPRGRDPPRRAGHDSRRASWNTGESRVAGISEKISTLANTLQDTSRNLTQVDRMLGQYREQTNDQTEAVALLRENLEESINQLQAQRQSRSTRPRSATASASTLHTSDLEALSGSDGQQRFVPSSPLKEYRPGRRRRSQSATVHFQDANPLGEDIHTLHQRLRDLQCGQQRLSDELDREVLRRNKSDIDTRRAMENLSKHLTTSQRQDSASSRVEQCLQELERGGRPDQGAAKSDNIQETLGRQVHVQERGEAIKARLLKSEREKSKMELELERARRLLEQSEGSRESLIQQLEEMHSELLRTRKEKMELQRVQPETSQSTAHHNDRKERRGGERGSDRSDLEKELMELRAQLNKASVLSEVEELKRTLDRKEKERLQLNIQLEELSSDLAQREQQQLRMLEQLKELQGRGETQRREMEVLLQESMKSRDELKTRAQEAVRQWRAKCRRMQKQLEETRAQADKVTEAAKEKEGSNAQLKVLSQQTEAVRRELTETLGHLAQREEELHCKELELSETRQHQMSLEQELREASAALEQEAQRQAVLQARLREENEKLEEQADSQARRSQRDQAARAELQAALKELTSAHAQLAQRLAEEESSRKKLQKSASELQAKLTVVQEERTTLGQQLQLEREVHQKELDSMKAMVEDGRTKKGHELQDMLRLCQQERDEMQGHIKEVEAATAADKELCGALRVKLDRMKDECDKLAEQLNTKEEAHTLLNRKYQLLKQQLDEKTKLEERKRVSAGELVKLEEKVLRMEAEQEVILSSVGEEIDVACRSLARDCEDKLQVISQKPALVKDPHCWLAETKTKLRWLCEEVRERDTREQRLRKQHQQTRDQLKALRQSRDSEQATLLERLHQQEKLLHSLSMEKKGLLERSRKKEEEMRSLQDRMLDLEMNTRVALDHLETIPEKLCLMENFKDLQESQRQKEMVQQRYAKYKEVVWDLQHQLDESKRRMQEYQDEKLDAASRSLKLEALSSSIKGTSTFLSNSLRSDTLSPNRRLTNPEFDDSTANGGKLLTD
ncbi:hypothetical protein LDENG_00081530 [Lucifuga dentata]|nr:hypothetical protein LDENG_00081530 [Lucifuga dentata]